MGEEGTDAVVGHEGVTTATGPWWDRRPGLLIAALVALLSVPLLVALAVLRSPRWFPVLDMAWTELRVRDVGSADPPLIGLAGRIGTPGQEGGHPGPLSFWAMWPFYKLFGTTPWALQAAGVALHLLASTAVLWVAQRRGGARLAIGVAAALALLVRAYGTTTLTESWNPYLPVLWWLVFLLAAWSVAGGDWPMVPVAAFAGSFCAQTHLPYLGLVLGLSGVVVAYLVVSTSARRRGTRAAPGLLRWGVLGLALAAAFWLPPVVDQLTRPEGNVTKLVDYFSEPPEDSIGLRQGARIMAVHLDPWQLVAGGDVTSRWDRGGSVVPGAVVLVAWAATVALAWRLRHRSLLLLHGVLGAALALGVLSLSRVFGFVWYYLSLWAGGTFALLLVAMGWTVASAVDRRLDAATRAGARLRAGRALQAGLAGVVVVSTAVFTVEASSAEVPDARLSGMLAELTPTTVAFLAEGGLPGTGRDGRYLVTWVDPVNIGAAGFGLLLELERQGFEVGAIESNQAGATPQRVFDRSEASAEVHLAVGPDVEVWRARGDATEVADVDPRNDAQRAEYTRVEADAVADLRAAGLTELAEGVDDNVFSTSNNVAMPRPIQARLQRLIELGLPAAVFVGPAEPGP